MIVWQVRLKREPSNYFFDNGSFPLDLRLAVEELIFKNGIPTEGIHHVDPNGMHVWGILGHVVVYRLEGQSIIVEVVIPAE